MPKIYLDSADIARIEAVKRTGVISGVTTNPVLIRTYLDEQKLGFSDYLSQLLHITQDLQLFIQPVAPNHKKFVTEARRFYEQYGEGRKIVIKVPLRISGSNRFYEGLIAINQLAQQGIEVNASAIVTPEQAVLASRAGA
ncbi:MAG: hypothetical protein NT076_02105, partial [Candidatus Pacearchaeota archaeon]|nr:hypothetical protein [Candidatus Pacearchaeota archaeon]